MFTVFELLLLDCGIRLMKIGLKLCIILELWSKLTFNFWLIFQAILTIYKYSSQLYNDLLAEKIKSNFCLFVVFMLLLNCG